MDLLQPVVENSLLEGVFCGIIATCDRTHFLRLLRIVFDSTIRAKWHSNGEVRSQF